MSKITGKPMPIHVFMNNSI